MIVSHHMATTIVLKLLLHLLIIAKLDHKRPMLTTLLTAAVVPVPVPVPDRDRFRLDRPLAVSPHVHLAAPVEMAHLLLWASQGGHHRDTRDIRGGGLLFLKGRWRLHDFGEEKEGDARLVGQ